MQKVISIFLSVLLLTSATGIAYGQHFCGGHLMNSMLTFSEAALNCGMEKTFTTCENKISKPDLHKKNCCDTEMHQVQTDDNFNAPHFQLELHKNFIVAFVSVFVFDPFEATFSRTETIHYFPPPIDKDVQVLYQVFLI